MAAAGQLSEGIVIIPAFNEEKNIVEVINGLRACKYNLDIVVINDGSTDNTAARVKELGETMICHLYNLGYGSALQTGFKYASALDYQYVIQFDADGQHDPQDIQHILDQFSTGDCDIVIGSRFLGSHQESSWLKNMAIGIFRCLIRASTGVRISDPTSGLQGLNRAAYEYFAAMGNFPEDFPDADTIIHMLKRKFRVQEIPVHFKSRLAGTSMHSLPKAAYYFAKMFVSISIILLRSKFMES